MRRGKKTLRVSRREMAQACHAYNSFAAGAIGKPPPEKPAILLKPIRKRSRPKLHASEHQEQAAVIAWWWSVHKRYQLPHFALFAVPNGGARDPIYGAKLKREGMRPGALDLILAKPTAKFSGLFIEMKAGNNRPSEEQERFISYLRSVGYWASVHWGAGTAIKEIETYLAASALELLP